MNIGIMIIAIIGGFVGIFSTVYLVISMPVVIGYKVYRKVKYKTSMFR